MRKQIVFYKGGLLRFVGHLDLMRTIQRALRRANIPLAYSQGFNPHPLLSFASPLALGWTGEREICEIKLETDMEDTVLLEKLSKELPTGLKLLSCREISDQEPSAMAKMAAAAYRIGLPDGPDWHRHLTELMNEPSIMIEKMGKVHGRKRLVQADIKPLIYQCNLEDSNTLYLLCACGSEKNLKPDLLIKVLYERAGKPELLYSETITRLELFTESSDGYQAFTAED